MYRTPKLTRTTKLLSANGYRLVARNGRKRTYKHDDNADGSFLLALSYSLRYAGWQADDSVPPLYRMPSAGLMIEIELGGADTAGHYLHLIDTRGEPDRPGPVRAFDRVSEAMAAAFGFLRQDEEKARVRLRAPWSSKMKLVLGVSVALLLFGSGLWASLSGGSLSQNTGAWVSHSR
jgi:hypothetical protein